MMKRIGSLLTALLLAWSLAGGVPAAAAEDAGDEDGEEETVVEETDIDAADISLDQEVTVQAEAGETRYFRFVPKSRDGYCFRSFSDNEECDPVAYLYDADMQMIASGDDDAGEINFRIAAMLEKGKTYYLGCEIVGEIAGSYPVRLEKASGLMAAEAEKVPAEIRKNMKLSVRAAATAKTKISYQWYFGEGALGEDEGIDELSWQIMEKQRKAVLTVARPAVKTGYCCRVTDDQGNEKAVYFFLDDTGIQVYNNETFEPEEDEAEYSAQAEDGEEEEEEEEEDETD